MAGLNNSDYAYWLNETAAQDCGEVDSIYIEYSNETNETITDGSEICSWMEDTDAAQIADVDKVVFSGIDEEDQPWSAVDERLTTNLERTENNGVVPVKIKRPRGQ